MPELPKISRNVSEPTTKKERGPFFVAVSDEYLRLCIQDLGAETVGSRIKGKFPALKYTLNGYDVTELSFEERKELIGLLYELEKEFFGEKPAKSRLEKTVLKLKERFGVEKEFEETLKVMPEGVLEFDKVKILPREDLEAYYKQTLLKLEKSKEFLEKNVAERTMALAAEKDVLETVLYNASDGVFALDSLGNIITFNKVMEELTGYLFEDVRNRPADEFIRIFENFAPLEAKAYCPSSSQSIEKFIYSNEKLTLVSRDGRKSYVKMVSTSIPAGQGVEVGCIITLTDITREIELDIMRLDFVSMAAHELRTPITSIRGYLEVLSDEIKGSLSDVHKQYFDRLEISSERLYILVENLLNISKIERGALVLDKKAEVWVSIVKEEVEKFSELAENSNLTLRFVESGVALSSVFVDKKIIGEVLSNLLDNAIKNSSENGWIEIILEEKDGFVVTHIKDNGMGIPPASIPHVFKKFYKATNVLKKGEEGTGLGLFIAKEIVRLHEGRIWVESEEGKGSTFSFTVPVYNKV